MKFIFLLSTLFSSASSFADCVEFHSAPVTIEHGNKYNYIAMHLQGGWDESKSQLDLVKKLILEPTEVSVLNSTSEELFGCKVNIMVLGADDPTTVYNLIYTAPQAIGLNDKAVCIYHSFANDDFVGCTIKP